MENLMTIIVLSLVLAVVAVNVVQQRKLSNTSINPLDEAEVYLAYGRKNEAKTILEKFLLTNPGDTRALELLKKATQQSAHV